MGKARGVLAKYDLQAKVGSGAYGHVWRARNKETGEICAIKQVFGALDSAVDAQRVYRQVQILQRLRHPNVVVLQEVMASAGADIYLVLQAAESDLFCAIRDRVLNALHRKYIVYQLAVCLQHLHSVGVVHRDLKPSNVLLSRTCRVKVCDFGLARTLHSRLFLVPIMTEVVSTRWYRAPQILFGSKAYSTPADMWSLGCLIYELYTRTTLLPGTDALDQLIKTIEFKGMPTAQEIESFKSNKIAKILTKVSVQALPLHYYFDKIEDHAVKEILQRLLEYNPHSRFTAKELISSSFLAEFRHLEDQGTQKLPMILPVNDNVQFSKEYYREQIEKSRRRQHPTQRKTFHKVNRSTPKISLHKEQREISKNRSIF